MTKFENSWGIDMTENYPEENIQHTEHGESLKSRNLSCLKMGWNVPELTTWVEGSIL
jgi:hypothetical protein